MVAKVHDGLITDMRGYATELCTCAMPRARCSRADPSAAGDGTRRVPTVPKAWVRSRARAGTEPHFAPQSVMTIFPRACPSPWYRRASGTSFKA